MEYLKATEESIKKAASVLKNGGIAAFPTETVYGLGADAFNPAALAKVFEAKGRPRFDPLIIHIANKDTLNKIADISLLSLEAKKKLFILIESFWPGPLSLVLPKNEKIPGLATAGLDTAAVRMPANEIAQKLIEHAGGAVAAPSANPFGALSPTTAEHVKEGLGDKVDIILDGGPCAVGVESTVLDITGDKVVILRHGGVTREAIEKVLNEQLAISNEQLIEKCGQGAVSPGMLKSHYAPRTPLTVFEKEEDITQQTFCDRNDRKEYSGAAEEKDAAWLFYDNKTYEKFKKKSVLIRANPWAKILSSNGDTQEAAACLFEKLHELDNLGVSRIYAQLAPEEGLGAAINDRLRRAGA